MTLFLFDAHLPREVEMFPRGIVRPVRFLRKAARHRGFVVISEREYSEVNVPGCLCLVPSQTSWKPNCKKKGSGHPPTDELSLRKAIVCTVQSSNNMLTAVKLVATP